MTRQTMEQKVQDILDADAIEYIGTNGNVVEFKSTSLCEDGVVYDTEIIITEDNSLVGECQCPAIMWSKADPKTCKHIESAIVMMKRDSIRMEYKALSNDESNHDEIVGKIKIESDDD